MQRNEKDEVGMEITKDNIKKQKGWSGNGKKITIMKGNIKE